MRLAVYAPDLGFALPERPFGKDVANRGLFTALCNHGGFTDITFRTTNAHPNSSTLAKYRDQSSCSNLFLTDLTDSDVALQAGTLLRGQPYLSELAWERSHNHGHQAYSLVGLIHTLAPPKVRELMGDVFIAPVQPWDALVYLTLSS